MWKFARVALLVVGVVLGDVGGGGALNYFETIGSKAVETSERGKQLDGSP